jgi:hypothetical protein
VNGQQAGENHRADEAQREVVRKQFRASHLEISMRGKQGIRENTYFPCIEIEYANSFDESIDATGA